MILGQRIRLRPVERDDLPRFVKWFADPELRSYLDSYLPFSLSQEEKWFEANLSGGDTQVLAIDAEPGESGGHWVHIGSCNFHHIHHRSRAGEIGILIGAPEYRSQGYGTDAVQTLVSFGFYTLNLNRVSLRVFADNARAIRCYEKVGFQLEGRLRQDSYNNGAYRDTLVMGLLRSDWEPSA